MRGDGDCFFRSYIFSLLEEMLYGLKRGDARVRKAHTGLIERIKGSKELLLQQNYQEVVRKASHWSFDVLGGYYASQSVRIL